MYFKSFLRNYRLKKHRTQVIIISMKFLFSVIKIYRLLNFIFAITDYGKHIKQLLNTQQRHTVTHNNQAPSKLGGLLGSLLSVCNPTVPGDLFQRNWVLLLTKIYGFSLLILRLPRSTQHSPRWQYCNLYQTRVKSGSFIPSF